MIYKKVSIKLCLFWIQHFIFHNSPLPPKKNGYPRKKPCIKTLEPLLEEKNILPAEIIWICILLLKYNYIQIVQQEGLLMRVFNI